MDTRLAILALNRIREVVKHIDGVGKPYLHSKAVDWIITIPLDEMRHKKLRATINALVVEAARGAEFVYEPTRLK